MDIGLEVRRATARATRAWRQTVTPYVLVAPTLLLLLVFVAWPLVQGIYYSFFQTGIIIDRNIPELTPHYVGAANYLQLVRDPQFIQSLARTTAFSVVTVPLTAAFSLSLALLMKQRFWGVGLMRAITYWPSMVSLIVVGIAWKWLLGYNSGLVNYVLNLLKLPPVPWLINGHLAQLAVMAVAVWAQAGFFMVILIAGLQTIPAELYEVAHIDGARAWSTFWHVTLPLLRPSLLIVVVLSSINAFKIYELVVALTGGGPGLDTVFLVQNIYQVAFRQPQAAGYAAAQSTVLLVVLLLLTAAQLRLGGEAAE